MPRRRLNSKVTGQHGRSKSFDGELIELREPLELGGSRSKLSQSLGGGSHSSLAHDAVELSAEFSLDKNCLYNSNHDSSSKNDMMKHHHSFSVSPTEYSTSDLSLADYGYDNDGSEDDDQMLLSPEKKGLLNKLFGGKKGGRRKSAIPSSSDETESAHMISNKSAHGRILGSSSIKKSGKEKKTKSGSKSIIEKESSTAKKTDAGQQVKEAKDDSEVLTKKKKSKETKGTKSKKPSKRRSKSLPIIRHSRKDKNSGKQTSPKTSAKENDNNNSSSSRTRSLREQLELDRQRMPSLPKSSDDASNASTLADGIKAVPLPSLLSGAGIEDPNNANLDLVLMPSDVFLNLDDEGNKDKDITPERPKNGSGGKSSSSSSSPLSSKKEDPKSPGKQRTKSTTGKGRERSKSPRKAKTHSNTNESQPAEAAGSTTKKATNKHRRRSSVGYENSNTSVDSSFKTASKSTTKRSGTRSRTKSDTDLLGKNSGSTKTDKSPTKRKVKTLSSSLSSSTDPTHNQRDDTTALMMPAQTHDQITNIKNNDCEKEEHELSQSESYLQFDFLGRSGDQNIETVQAGSEPQPVLPPPQLRTVSSIGSKDGPPPSQPPTSPLRRSLHNVGSPFSRRRSTGGAGGVTSLRV